MAGGSWSKAAREAARALVEQSEEDDADSTNVRLLSDIRDVFEAMVGVSFLKSSVLCDELRALADSPWSQYDLNPSRLGRRLREYRIRTGHNTTKTERGYRLDDFQDAFDRYLPASELAPTVPVSVSTVSEGVRSRPNSFDQQEASDTLKPTDTLKASAATKASHDKPSSNGIRTPSDTFGHHADRKPVCDGCDRAPAHAETGLCDLCTAKAKASNGGTAA